VAEGVTKKASEFAVSLVFESMDFSLVKGDRIEM
jgi:nucleoid DNA-binding protein